MLLKSEIRDKEIKIKDWQIFSSTNYKEPGNKPLDQKNPRL